MRDIVESTLPHRLLQLLSDGGVHSTAELARRLGISEGLVSAIMEDLTRRGYLSPIGLDCGTSCSACWAAASCHRPQPATPTLTLTPKGRQASYNTS